MMKVCIKMNEKLAVDGGTPVRTRAFPCYWGAAVIGDEELALVTEVIRSRSLFRDSGESKPHMVDDLELEACSKHNRNNIYCIMS